MNSTVGFNYMRNDPWFNRLHCKKLPVHPSPWALSHANSEGGARVNRWIKPKVYKPTDNYRKTEVTLHDYTFI